MSEREETTWDMGNKAAWCRMLGECLRQLGSDDPSANAARWAKERADVILMLRSLCLEFGDNEWTDDLYLADVIDKHLGDHLRK